MTKTTRTDSGLVSDSDEFEGESSSIQNAESNLQTHLEGVKTGANQLFRQLKALRNENKSLKQRLKRAEDQIQSLPSANGKRDRQESGSSSLTAQVAGLKVKVDELRTENKRQRKKIERFEQKELEAEAEDLSTRTLKENGEIDPEYRMRKLLRKFNDYMLINTIEDDSKETCVICFEPFVVKKCSSLDCQHIVCNDCLPLISKGADETIKCPTCRDTTNREDVQLIHMTEGERWDRLLEIAQAWAAWDHRGEMETSEEESEEQFLTDGEGMTDSSAIVSQSGKTSDDEPLATGNETEIKFEEQEDSDVSYQQRRLRSRPEPYSQSPTKEKRKILEQLAEERERAHKRRR